MIYKSIFRSIITFCEYRATHNRTCNSIRWLGCSAFRYKDKSESQLTHFSEFDRVKNKNKNTYLEMIKIFVNRDNVYRRGHVEFIHSALKSMRTYGVEKDIEVYKSLIDIMPKGKYVPTNLIQAEFMHYPKQQQCIVDLLQQMEDNGVIPDVEMHDMLINIFGKRGFPVRKYYRMMYWMPKFKNLTPWPLPDVIPNDVLEIAKLAISRITSVDSQTCVKVYHSADIEDSVDDTWIVSGQSPTQKKLLQERKVTEAIYVEGQFRVWIKDRQVNYFILRANPKIQLVEEPDLDDVKNLKVPLFMFSRPVKKKLIVIPSIHEQEEGVILAVCATGTSSKDSLLSWIRHLEKDGNPILATLPVVFTLRSPPMEVALSESDQIKDVKES